MNLRRGRPGRLPPPEPGFSERLTPADRAGIQEMLSCSVVGEPATVRRGIEALVERTGADELMIASQIYDHDARRRSYELAAAALPEPVVVT